MKERLRAEARALGFTRAGFCAADAIRSEVPHWLDWLTGGHHAGMAYLERSAARRADPTLLLRSARTLLVVTAAYPPASGGAVASYAMLRDYHREMTQRLERLLCFARTLGEGIEGLVCVDTKPILERAAARHAGVGWIGKNTMLLDEESGPWTMLGVLLLSIELPADAPAKHRCGTCTRCLDACPTQAFVAPYVLDARRCISYWTIEHRGPIPHEFRAAIGGRLFGCDDCLTACPFGPPRTLTGEPVLPLADELADLTPHEVIARLEAGFTRHFKRYAIARSGKAGLLRNCLTALGNRTRAGDAETVRRFLRHDDLGVRSHAAWALGRIGEDADIDLLRAAAASEHDADARREQLHSVHALERRHGQTP